MSRRRDYPAGEGPARWHVTVASADGLTMLWHGDPATQAEAEALAVAARRLRPEARIFVRSPLGRVEPR